MKRAGFVAAAVLLVAVLGLPRVLGGVTESQVEARVADINGGDVLRVTVDDYTRGWFTSSADLSVRPAPEYLARLGAAEAGLPSWLSADRALPVRAEIAHGPAGLNEGPFVGLSKVVARADPDTAWVRDVTETYGLPYLFEFRGRTGFTGRVSFEADVPPLDTAATGGNARLSGTDIEGTLAGNRLVAELDVGELDVTGPALSVLLSGVHASTDARLRDDGRTTGKASLEVAELGLSVQAGEPQTLQMTGVRVASEAAVEGGSWSTRLDYTSDSITTSGGRRFESAALGFAVDNLDAAAVDELRALLEQRPAAPGAPSVAPPDVIPVLNRILAGSPSLEIAPISFTSDGDAFDANARLDVRGDAAPLDMPALAGSPDGWLSLVDGSLDATVAKPLARRLAAAQLAAQPGHEPGPVDPGRPIPGRPDARHAVRPGLPRGHRRRVFDERPPARRQPHDQRRGRAFARDALSPGVRRPGRPAGARQRSTARNRRRPSPTRPARRPSPPPRRRRATRLPRRRRPRRRGPARGRPRSPRPRPP